MQVTAQYAFSHFDDIASVVDRGEPVEILRPGKAALQLVPAHTPEPKRLRRELLYAWEGKVMLPTEEEWRAMDKEIEDDMLNGAIFPADHL